MTDTITSKTIDLSSWITQQIINLTAFKLIPICSSSPCSKSVVCISIMNCVNKKHVRGECFWMKSVGYIALIVLPPSSFIPLFIYFFVDFPCDVSQAIRMVFMKRFIMRDMTPLHWYRCIKIQGVVSLKSAIYICLSNYVCKSPEAVRRAHSIQRLCYWLYDRGLGIWYHREAKILVSPPHPHRHFDPLKLLFSGLDV